MKLMNKKSKGSKGKKIKNEYKLKLNRNKKLKIIYGFLKIIITYKLISLVVTFLYHLIPFLIKKKEKKHIKKKYLLLYLCTKSRSGTVSGHWTILVQFCITISSLKTTINH